jgi:glycosyltransferase involved in cell wall biosynthesis
VLVLAPYPLDRAPSQRFRWEQYVEPLRARGIFLEPSSFLDDHGLDVAHKAGKWPEKAAATLAGGWRRLRDVCVARRYDLVLVHREALPVGLASVERLVTMLGVPYAFDFDDAIYLGAASAANQRLAWLRGAHKTATVARRASLVLAGNEHLAHWARALGARAVVVPTTIDTEAYRPDGAKADGPLCVGWSGSATTIEHLRLLEPTLRELQRERGIQIRVIGDPTYSLDGAAVDVLPWRAESEVADLRPIDIGVMPLPDDEWARGKCGLKALQYMALGIPTVVSPVGVNGHIARDGAALLASTPGEWAATLRRLLDEPRLRAEVGAAGRARVQQEYSVSATLPAWEHALRTAAVGGGR